MSLLRALKVVSSVKSTVQMRLSSSSSSKKGLVLGAYTKDDGKFTLTPKAECFNENNSGILVDNLHVSGIKKGTARIFYRPSSDYDVVAVVGIGKQDVGYNESEDIDEKREDVRAAAGVGVKNLQSLDMSQIDVEDLGDAQASAEGATLGLFGYQAFKNEKKRKKIPRLTAYDLTDESKSQWDSGVIQGEAQNWTRELMDTPANHLTPEIFAQKVQEELSKVRVDVKVHDEAWAKSKGMGSFLSVAQGSDQPPKFLEMSLKNGPEDSKPIVLVGKGVTFDSGGISIKPSAKMDEMRGDMGGAACVVSTIKAAALLNLPVNIIGLTPLTENLVNGRATKPGDIVTAMNGKTIQVDNTDAEGRLILADALCYATEFDPRATLDIATLTGAMRVALGGALTGVFSNSTPLWEELRRAGVVTGDRVWRFPLFKHYTKRVTDFPNVDVNNVGKGTGGGACTAAAFLKEFAPTEGGWMHLDIAGVSGPDGFPDAPYLDSRMSGRPTRTLIQFVRQLSETSC